MKICIMCVMSRAIYISIDYGHLTRLGEVLSEHLGKSEATISKWIVGHARLFARARRQEGCNAHTYRDVMMWFLDYWPEDLEWPSDVPRPIPIPDLVRRQPE